MPVFLVSPAMPGALYPCSDAADRWITRSDAATDTNVSRRDIMPAWNSNANNSTAPMSAAARTASLDDGRSSFSSSNS
eukprot:365747-Chlamydomonas_euryale.AAC.30